MYVLFAGRKDRYNGGMGDYIGTFPTFEEARRNAYTTLRKGEDWYDIAQLFDGKLLLIEVWRPTDHIGLDGKSLVFKVWRGDHQLSLEKNTLT